MNVEIFTFCRNVSRNQGALSIEGILQGWQGARFPAAIPSFNVFIRVRVPEVVIAEKVRFELFSPDGIALITVVEPIAGPSVDLVFKFHHLTLPTPGTYHADITFRGETICDLPFLASLSPGDLNANAAIYMN